MVKLKGAIQTDKEADMFIQTEDTPNPSTLKFIPGVDVLPGNTAEFTSADSAQTSPLATRLFAVDGVDSVDGVRWCLWC